MNQQNKEAIETRFRILYLLAVHIDIKELINKLYKIGLMIDSDHPRAEERLIFYERNILAIFSEDETKVKDIPAELFGNLFLN